MRSISYTIDNEYFEGKKLISFLRGHVKISVGLLRSLKRRENGILINGSHARTVDILRLGDTVTLNFPDDETTAAPIDYPLEIIYEDEDILIVNKPAGLPMHESHNHQQDTLANALAGYLTKKGKRAVFRSVGRLDMGTSGAVVCALNSHVTARLSGNIEKEYIAVPSGKYTRSGTIDKPIYRPDPMKTYRTVDDRGDRALTHYTPLLYGENFSVVSVRLETGRTHQIRVHFASMGTPLLGDTMYGEEHETIKRQALHCSRVSFTHPITNEKITVEAPLPEDMQKLITSLEKGENKNGNTYCPSRRPQLHP